MFKKFVSWWNIHSQFGTEGKTPGLAKRLVLANQIGLTLGFVAIAFVFPWAFKGSAIMVLANILVAGIHLITPWLNKWGYVNLSRYSLLFWLPTFMFVFSGMVGEESGIHLIFYTITAFSCLMFDPKEKLKLAVAVAYPILLFSILLYYDFHVFPNVIEDEGFKGINHFSNFLLISLTMFYLFRTSEKMETDYRHIFEKHVEAQRLLDEERAKSIYSMRMAALGEMAGGIAHEINSPLNVITILSDQISKRYPVDKMPKEHVIESIEKINSTANRIGEIVSSLRSFSRTGEGLPYKECDVRHIIHETLVLCRERFRSRDIHLKFEIPSEIRPVFCRQTEISQILLNLLNNACDALEGIENSTIEVSIHVEADYVYIGVADNGSGIKPEIREKIFTPFFTTKDIGKGTGLGLSISKGLIEANRGKLYLDSKSAQTRFVMAVPTTPKHRTFM